jgi:hypothetical protein
MALLSKQPISAVGSTPTLAAASGGGDTVAMDGSGITILIIKNADASPKTITIADARRPLGQVQPGVATIVAAGATGYIVLDPNTADVNGLANIAYSAVTSVTVGVIRV